MLAPKRRGSKRELDDVVHDVDRCRPLCRHVVEPPCLSLISRICCRPRRKRLSTSYLHVIVCPSTPRTDCAAGFHPQVFMHARGSCLRSVVAPALPAAMADRPTKRMRGKTPPPRQPQMPLVGHKFDSEADAKKGRAVYLVTLPHPKAAKSADGFSLVSF